MFTARDGLKLKSIIHCVIDASSWPLLLDSPLRTCDTMQRTHFQLYISTGWVVRQYYHSFKTSPATALAITRFSSPIKVSGSCLHYGKHRNFLGTRHRRWRAVPPCAHVHLRHAYVRFASANFASPCSGRWFGGTGGVGLHVREEQEEETNQDSRKCICSTNACVVRGAGFSRRNPKREKQCQG